VSDAPVPHTRPLGSHRDFLLFWAGETVSLFGSQITVLALPLTALLVLHVSPIQLGILNAAGFLPFLLIALPAGAWLDRYRRRPILLASNVGRAIVIGLVPLAAFAGLLRIELLYAVAFIHGVLAVFYEVGWLSYIPTILARDQVIGANRRLQASASAAQIGGPGVGGILVQLLSAPIALVADAGSFVFSAATLALIRAREPMPPRPEERSLGREIAEGLRVTFGKPVLRAMALNAGTYNLFDQVLITAFLLYAIGPLRLPPSVLGLVLAAGSVGGLVGAVLAERVGRALGVGPAMIVASFIGGSSVVLIPFVGGDLAVIATLLGAIFFVQGVGVGLSNVHFVSLRQAVTPPELLGRMNASYRTVSYGAIPIGALLGGAIAQVFGLREALLVAGAGLLLAPLIVVFSPLPRIRELPRSVAAQ
jgi:MFS family permease